MSAIFADRRGAGRKLAAALKRLDPADPVVLALPRGGVGYEVAKALGAPLDVLFVRKIGAPGHEEYGIGALVDGSAPQIVIDSQAARLWAPRPSTASAPSPVSLPRSNGAGAFIAPDRRRNCRATR